MSYSTIAITFGPDTDVKGFSRACFLYSRYLDKAAGTAALGMKKPLVKAVASSSTYYCNHVVFL